LEAALSIVFTAFLRAVLAAAALPSLMASITRRVAVLVRDFIILFLKVLFIVTLMRFFAVFEFAKLLTSVYGIKINSNNNTTDYKACQGFFEIGSGHLR
jgi:hypothetical protein